MALVFGIAVEGACGSFAQGTVPETLPASIQVDLEQKVGAYTPIYGWFGYDEANYTTMRHGRELLRKLHDLSPVPVYIRAHHLLTSGD
jgi:xylan 1,4-beta-xylosidase